MIKRRCVGTCLTPRISQARTIAVGQWEVTICPERLGEVRIHDLQETHVDVCENVLLAPLWEYDQWEILPEGTGTTYFHAESVVVSCVGSVKGFALDVVEPPTIIKWVGTKM